MKKAAWWALAFVGFLFLTFLYLYPGVNAIIAGDTTKAMSDNTDQAAVPYEYAALLKTWQEHPSRFFYGAVYMEALDPIQGWADWKSWSERWLVVVSSYLVPLEQISPTVIIWLLMFNALAMYFLCRYLKWNQSISIGLAIAWTFCAFMRARAKVHSTMTATYHLPLIFLGLLLVIRGRSKKSLLGAAACFLLALTVVHYFIMTTLFLAPFFIAYVLIQPEFRKDWKRIIVRLGIAIAPAIAFLGLNFMNPIPADVKMAGSNSMPQSGATPNGEIHPFVSYYAAHPIDYLTNDIALEIKPNDLNPIRWLINDYVLKNMTESNPHERTNGIRWSILFLSIFAVGGLLLRRLPREQIEFRQVMFFAVFALFTFWLSLKPDIPFAGMGPSGWLYQLVSQIRVPSRAGINTHFALLMIAGFFLSSRVLEKTKWKKILLMPAVFPAVMVLDYPPLIQQMPMAEISPNYAYLKPNNTDCGVGMAFPYFSPWTDVAFYHILQKIRGTDCQLLNAVTSTDKIQWMTNRFPPQQNFINMLTSTTAIADALERVVTCVPLSWIAFDRSVPPQWAAEFCNRLNWKMNSDYTCVSQGPHLPFRQFPDRCIQ